MNTNLPDQPETTTSSEGQVEGPAPLPWEEPPSAQAEFIEPLPSAGPKLLAGAARQIWLLTVVIFLSAISYYCMSRFVVTTVIIQGESMTPTLRDGERYLLNRWAFHFRKPDRGDLVVLKDPGHTDFAIKRVVGVPLDVLVLKEGNLYINGCLANEPYLAEGTRTYSLNHRTTLIFVGKDRYFVLGDCRSNSEDSRIYGPVRRDQILGPINLTSRVRASEIGAVSEIKSAVSQVRTTARCLAAAFSGAHRSNASVGRKSTSRQVTTCKPQVAKCAYEL